ncbi:hypothetical protein CCACVL1_01181 [Corchorus capsularis]|uniref:Retrotransposon gag protein n=1 Tax=Corchorus capsularis TaxID=210143 RepID=A0A1R3KLN3_COCAP|nr:hypothetical protein CCACVL1_01181 [Corchorus capsularis]
MGLIEFLDMAGLLDGSLPTPSRSIETDDETLGLVVGLDTAVEVWQALTDTFAGNTQEHELALERKLRKHHRDKFSFMDDYIRVFKEICDEFTAIGKPSPNIEKVFALLTGLGKDHESFVTTMMKPPRPTYYELISQLKSHEIIRMTPEKVMVGNDASIDISHSGSIVLKVGDEQIVLDNVTVVLDIKKNLISITQLTTDNPYNVEFSDIGFQIRDRRTGEVIATGKLWMISMS